LQRSDHRNLPTSHNVAERTALQPMPALSKWQIVNWRKHQPVRSAIGRQRSLIPQVVDVLDLVGVAERDSSTLQVASA